MIIEINKDIEKYKESVVLGLTAKQLICSVLSVIIGGGVVLLLYPRIGLTGSAYVAVPVVAPIAMSGFYSYNGMSFLELIKRRFCMIFANRPIFYVSTEGEKLVKELPEGKKGKKRVFSEKQFVERKDIKKQMKWNLFMAFAVLLVFGVITVMYQGGYF